LQELFPLKKEKTMRTFEEMKSILDHDGLVEATAEEAVLFSPHTYSHFWNSDYSIATIMYLRDPRDEYIDRVEDDWHKSVFFD
jgi:hypothetical protein